MCRRQREVVGWQYESLEEELRRHKMLCDDYM